MKTPGFQTALAGMLGSCYFMPKSAEKQIAKSTIAVLVLYLLLPLQAVAQNQNNKWYFGKNAALDFNSGSPVPILTSAMVSKEGCASVADDVTGELLFYTNGVTVYNANNAVMTNGTGLLAGPNTSSTQGALIVKYPQNPGKYFIFTTDESFNPGDKPLYYSVVDMSLDGGLGAVMPTQKNILLQNNSTERLAVAPIANGSGFWVMTHQRGNNEFKAFAVTATGVNPTPVTSNTGMVHNSVVTLEGDGTMGYLKFNNGYNKLAVAIYRFRRVQVFDFDACTGVVSNPLTIPSASSPYGVEFSPDDSRLYYCFSIYVTGPGRIYQVDMLAANPASTVTLVGESSSTYNPQLGTLQLAPDGKIYISVFRMPWLSAITHPNNLGTACGFVDKAVLLPTDSIVEPLCNFGLPQKVINTLPFSVTAWPANTVCAGQPVSLMASGATAYSWSNGQTGPVIQVTPDSNTTYTVTGTMLGCSTQPLETTITVTPLPVVAVAASQTEICTGTSTSLSASGANSYTWSPATSLSSSTGSMVTASPAAPASYTVMGTLNNCSSSATISIALKTAPEAIGGNSITLPCGITNTTLAAAPPVNGTGHWLVAGGAGGSLSAPDFPASLFSGNAGQTYMLVWAVSNECGTNTDTIQIRLPAEAVVSAGNDTSLVLGQSIVLHATGGTYYSWWPATGLSDDLAAAPLASPRHTTTYSVTGITADGCMAIATVTVLVTEPDLHIPNVFTPNGDGLNDTWAIHGLREAYPECQVQVFTRWGKVIFSSDGYPADWDGKAGDRHYEAGVYYYLIQPGPGKKPYKGTVSIVR